ncbi:beta-glucosidase [candidate division WOR-3 bacterium]|nr:beta-glucosidase [candidate division WOR-3 bacterium]
MTEPFLLFPDGFIWGCATASYQIEGAFDEDSKGESIWDRFSHTPGKITNGDTGDMACNHYHRFAEDVNLMSKIGLKAYRFSISWPRILPDGIGEANEKGLAFYDRLVDKLLEKQIIPFVTLYHWDLPQALEDKGGWRNKDTAFAFAEYAKVVVNCLSDRVTKWMTLNEAPCVVHGYQREDSAPGVREPEKVINQIIHNLLLAHGLGVQVIRENAKKQPEVGLVHNPSVKIPKTNSPEDTAAVKAAWFDANAWWFEPLYRGKYPERLWREKRNDIPQITDEDMKIISTPTDFLGLNIYTGNLVEADHNSDSEGLKEVTYPREQPKTAMGWYINPDCIYYGLKAVAERYDVKKFFISENGCAFDDVVSYDGNIYDHYRINYLKDHFLSAYRAVSEGINLVGYFVWSLMDNFEWTHGYSKRFGILFIDYNNSQKRILKESALWYKNIIEQNGIFR